MRTWQGIRIACLGSLLLLAACAQRSGGAGDAEPGGPADGGGAQSMVAIRVDQTGGYLAQAARVARAPIVTVYSDGRVIMPGPQTLVFPGPALPNLQQRRIPVEEVDRLIERARAVGVGAGKDLGRPSSTDLASTRFTVSSATGTDVLEVYGLSEGVQQSAGLTEAQRAGRAELQKLLDVLTDPAGAAGATEPYRPEALVAVAVPWRADSGGLPAPSEVAWPGPALPGAPLAPGLDENCVEVRGAEATRVLTAADKATALTPWTSGGDRWQVTLRPLLPDEAGCGELSGD